MAFDPRYVTKRSNKMPPVRLTDDERLAVDWLTARLSAERAPPGQEFSISDAIRAIVGEAVRREVQKAEQAGEPVPEAVRRLLA
jgi:hypothetical protein